MGMRVEDGEDGCLRRHSHKFDADVALTSSDASLLRCKMRKDEVEDGWRMGCLRL